MRAFNIADLIGKNVRFIKEDDLTGEPIEYDHEKLVALEFHSGWQAVFCNARDFRFAVPVKQIIDMVEVYCD